MEYSLPPFEVGDEVVCVDDRPGAISGEKMLCKGSVYKISGLKQESFQWKVYIPGTDCDYYYGWWLPYRFRRISPYQNSVSRSLAEQALKDTGDSRQDMKPERKEVEV